MLAQLQVVLNEQDRVESARTLLRQALASKSNSQTVLARQLGISTAALSQFAAGKYAGDNQAIADRIHYGFTKIREQTAAPKDPAYVQTSLTEAVTTVLVYAHSHRTMGLIHGDAGVGKSMAVEQYAREHPDVVVVTADPSLRTSKAMIDELLEAMGRRESGTLRSKMKMLVNLLTGTGRLIIVDEAQHLALATKETLRALHDKAGVGIVFCGNQELYEKLRGGSESAYAQFFSRLGIRRCLHAPIPTEDVRRIFAPLVLERECLELLQLAANSGKGIRGAVKIYRLAATLAQQQGSDLSPDLLRQAARFLMMQA